jgi:hypothetical protein
VDIKLSFREVTFVGPRVSKRNQKNSPWKIAFYSSEVKRGRLYTYRESPEAQVTSQTINLPRSSRILASLPPCCCDVKVKTVLPPLRPHNVLNRRRSYYYSDCIRVCLWSKQGATDVNGLFKKVSGGVMEARLIMRALPRWYCCWRSDRLVGRAIANYSTEYRAENHDATRTAHCNCTSQRCSL